MSLLERIQDALTGIGIPVGNGQYPEGPGVCAKIVFTGAEKIDGFMGGRNDSEAFKVIVRGNDYGALETHCGFARNGLTSADFIQTIGFEDIRPEEGEELLQLAVTFKSIKN